MSRAPGRLLLLAAGLAVGMSACQSLRREKPAPPVPQAPAPKPPLLVFPRRTPPPPPLAPPPAPPKSCVPKTVGAAPRYPDSEAALRAAPGAADRYQLLAAGRILRTERLDELEKVIAGCR